jgi:hypothetical protein
MGESDRERAGGGRLPGGLLQAADGRSTGDVIELPGVTVHGATTEEATLKAGDLAFRVIAEGIEYGEMKPGSDLVQFSTAA